MESQFKKIWKELNTNIEKTLKKVKIGHYLIEVEDLSSVTGEPFSTINIFDERTNTNVGYIRSVQNKKVDSVVKDLIEKFKNKLGNDKKREKEITSGELSELKQKIAETIESYFSSSRFLKIVQRDAPKITSSKLNEIKDRFYKTMSRIFIDEYKAKRAEGQSHKSLLSGINLNSVHSVFSHY